MNKGMAEPAWFRQRVWVGAILLALFSAFVFLGRQDAAAVWTCLGTVILVSLPVVLPRAMGFQLSAGFFLCCMLYALGPMLGKAFRLYYLTPWWDKLLHLWGGVVFGALGTGVVLAMGCGRTMAIWFGLFFSVAVAGIWELFEFGMDLFLGTDMQSDTVISSICSHDLSSLMGELGVIGDIRQVSVNGIPLNLGGYLDIGLIDTMHDMLVESLGAVACGVYLGRHSQALPVKRVN